MARRIIPSALACLVAASPSPASAQAEREPLAYRVPATPNVTYHTADTLAQTFNAPGGTATYTLSLAATLATTFEEHASGLRITADVESVTATMAAPMGTEPLPLRVTGAYVFAMGPDGAVEAISRPKIPGPAETVTPLAGLHHEWFPLLPAAPVQPGDSWSGTVAWSYEGSMSRASSSTVFTYAMVGDTMVGGRSFLKISIAGDAELESGTNQNGADLVTILAGASTGHALWDAERGLLHSVGIAFHYSGTMNTPMGELPVSVVGSSRRWLEN